MERSLKGPADWEKRGKLEFLWARGVALLEDRREVWSKARFLMNSSKGWQCPEAVYMSVGDWGRDHMMCIAVKGQRTVRLEWWMATWTLNLGCVTSDGGETMPGIQLINHRHSRIMDRKALNQAGSLQWPWTVATQLHADRNARMAKWQEPQRRRGFKDY